jgi:hypothetical protein
MNAIELLKAIKYLKPNAEFSFEEADYSTIKWDVLSGDAPTLKELESALKKVIELEQKIEADKIIAKSAAEAKLEALGLTLDDLKALGIG